MTETSELSERELEILRLVATGATNKEIAQRLTISSNTVKVHLRNIFGKIGVASRTEAALYAVNNGLVEGALPDEALRRETEDELDEPLGMAPEAAVPAGNGPAAVGRPAGSGGGIPTAALPETAAGRPARPRSLIALFILGIAALAVVLAVIYFSGRDLENPPATAEPPPPAAAASPRWQELAPVPTGRYGFGLVSHAGYLYAVAGSTAEGVTGALERYNPNDNTWQPLPPKPEPVGEVKAAVVEGKIFVPGGVRADGTTSDLLEIYDPQAEAWSQGQPLPAPLSAYALVAFEGKLYLFGGRNGDEYTGVAYSYDPGQDTWEELPALPTARAYAGAAVSGDRIFVIGGLNDSGALNANEAYLPGVENPGTAWQIAPAMPERRYGHGVTSVADMVFVVGGEEVAPSEEQPVATEEQSAAIEQPGYQFSPLTGTWQAFQSPAGGTTDSPGLAGLGSHLYVMGGTHGEETVGESYAYQVIYSILMPYVPQDQE